MSECTGRVHCDIMECSGVDDSMMECESSCFHAKRTTHICTLYEWELPMLWIYCHVWLCFVNEITLQITQISNVYSVFICICSIIWLCQYCILQLYYNHTQVPWQLLWITTIWIDLNLPSLNICNIELKTANIQRNNILKRKVVFSSTIYFKHQPSTENKLKYKSNRTCEPVKNLSEILMNC